MIELQPAPSPKPRRFRRLLIVFGIGTLGLLAFGWFAPVIVAKTSLRNTVANRLASGLNGEIHIGEASFAWNAPLVLREVTITDSAGATALTAKTITSSATLLQLAVNSGDLGSFTIDFPVLSVACEPGSTNLETLIANFLAADDSPQTPERAGLELIVTNGKAIVSEKGTAIEREMEPLQLRVSIPRPRSEPIAISLDSPELKTTASLGEETKIELSANRFPVETLGPILRRFSQDSTRISGRLTAKLTTGISPIRTEVQGHATLASLDLSAPWLDGERVQLQQVELPIHAEIEKHELRLHDTSLTCDAGRISIAGVYDRGDTLDALIARQDQHLEADVDLAKVAAILPKLLRLKPGTEIREGRIALKLDSRAENGGTVWDGTLATTDLRGERAGRPLMWEKPLKAAFTAHRRDDGLPEFDKLECQSDFIGLAARGSRESFVVAANLDLDRLSARLVDFVDLHGTKLGGTAKLEAELMRQNGGMHHLTTTATLTQFTLTEANGQGIREPNLRLIVEAIGRLHPDGPVEIVTAETKVQAGEDELRAVLQKPIPDARTLTSGQVSFLVLGDLTRWRNRLVEVVPIPKHYVFAGTAQVVGDLTFNDTGLRFQRITADVKNAVFQGAGLNLAEAELKAESGLSWDHASEIITFSDVKLNCATATATAKAIVLKPDSILGYGAAGTVEIATTDLARLQRTLKLAFDPKGSDTLGGIATGPFTFDVHENTVAFNADLACKQFLLGPLAKPSWSEPWLKVKTDGTYDFKEDTVSFQQANIVREGLGIDAKGAFTNIGTTQQINLEGNLTYDLAHLEPTLKEYLGKSAEIAGKGTRPFSLSGSLAGSPNPVAVSLGSDLPAGTTAPSLAPLKGSAAIAWSSVKAYGFVMGPAELIATINNGTVTMNPIEATFGEGKVKLQPTLTATGDQYDLRFAKGRIVEKAQLTPAVCADALGYALPAIANAAQAEGLMSFDLAENSIPLSNPTAATITGTLTLHEASLSAGPILSQVITLIGADDAKMDLTKEQAVPLRIEKGRVHHKDFKLKIGGTTVSTTGSVGFDGSLSMVIEMPMPGSLLKNIPSNQPRIRELLAKHTLKVPVGGTMSRPQLDPAAFHAQVQTALRNAARHAVTDLRDDLIKKGTDKLFDRLREKLGSPPEPKK